MGLFLMIAAVTSNPAVAAGDSLSAGAYWRLDFGGDTRAPSLRYGFALRQADLAPGDATVPPLATLDFAPLGTDFKVAGVALWRRNSRLGQSEISEIYDEGDETAAPAHEGWLFGWGLAPTLAAVGGVVAAALLLADDGDRHPQDEADFSDDGGAPDGVITAGGNEVCVFKGNPPLPETCTERP